MGFQNSVNNALPTAVAGDFASSNPRSAVVPPVAAFQADVGGLNIGLFAWIQSGGVLVKNTGTGKPSGFVHRDQQGVNTLYLSDAGINIPHGFPVTLMKNGDYFAAVTVSAATAGQKAFAKLTDGTMQPGNAGATISGYVETDFTIGTAGAVGELVVITL